MGAARSSRTSVNKYQTTRRYIFPSRVISCTDVRFEVLTALTIYRTLFYDVMQSSSVEVRRRFGKKQCLDLQGRREVKQVPSKKKAANKAIFRQ
jgi:hypothetical protein